MPSESKYLWSRTGKRDLFLLVHRYAPRIPASAPQLVHESQRSGVSTAHTCLVIGSDQQSDPERRLVRYIWCVSPPPAGAQCMKCAVVVPNMVMHLQLKVSFTPQIHSSASKGSFLCNGDHLHHLSNTCLLLQCHLLFSGLCSHKLEH